MSNLTSEESEYLDEGHLRGGLFGLLRPLRGLAMTDFKIFARISRFLASLYMEIYKDANGGAFMRRKEQEVMLTKGTQCDKITERLR